MSKRNLIAWLAVLALLAGPLLLDNFGASSLDVIAPMLIGLLLWQRYGRRRFGTAYAGLKHQESRDVAGLSVTALFHPRDHLEEDSPGLVTRVVGNPAVELRFADVIPAGTDRALAQAWLDRRALQEDDLRFTLRLEETTLVASGEDASLAHDRREQVKRLAFLASLGHELQVAAKEDGLLAWAAASPEAAVRLMVANPIDPVGIRVEIIEDPTTPRVTLDYAIRGLIPHLVGQPEEAKTLARGWMGRFEVWLVEAGLRVAASLSGEAAASLQPAVLACAEVLCASAGEQDSLALELQSALVAAARALEGGPDGGQDGLLAILRLRDPVVVAAAARRLGVVGDVRAVAPLLELTERFRRWGWTAEVMARQNDTLDAARDAARQIQGRLTHAEAGGFALSEVDGVGGIALAGTAEASGAIALSDAVGAPEAAADSATDTEAEAKRSAKLRSARREKPGSS